GRGGRAAAAAARVRAQAAAAAPGRRAALRRLLPRGSQIKVRICAGKIEESQRNPVRRFGVHFKTSKHSMTNHDVYFLRLFDNVVSVQSYWCLSYFFLYCALLFCTQTTMYVYNQSQLTFFYFF
ncbi:unnamed protein product, partial [Heterosigma akashiwo]